MSIFNKVLQATEAALDQYISKAKSTSVVEEHEARKGMIDLMYPEAEQYGWKERPSMIGSGVLKNMARKDSIVAAIISTKISQVAPFTKPQKDRYSEGFRIVPRKPADISDEDKLSLADPNLEEDEYNQLKFKLDKKLQKIKEKQEEEIQKVLKFVMHCGADDGETDTTYERWDFDKFVKAVISDRLTYNYGAIELVPTKDGDRLHHFYPISSGTIKYVSKESAETYQKLLQDFVGDPSRIKKRFDSNKPFRYVQVVRGKVVAAFTEDELIFEPGTPTVDPEDNGYAPGELELLIKIITAHLYAEAHNTNFFTQGIGTKGILHIKGDNISRAQLEAFKRQWFSQVVNSKNAFRPPVIGMADDVRWVSLAQSNREMEYEQWMNYLIRIACAVFQIDPAEINFDISKVSTSTLNESSNEGRLKASKAKGIRPLLDYIEGIVNNHILRYWNEELADKYEFKFVGFDAESRKEEVERLQKETQIWKTVNEARIEMGYPPIEDGDIILAATYTQYKQIKLTAKQDQSDQSGEEVPQGESNNENTNDADSDLDNLDEAIDEAIKQADQENKTESEKNDEKTESGPQEETQKSQTPLIIEYYKK